MSFAPCWIMPSMTRSDSALSGTFSASMSFSPGIFRFISSRPSFMDRL